MTGLSSGSISNGWSEITGVEATFATATCWGMSTLVPVEMLGR